MRATRFPIEAFGCPVAFTMDGGYSGDLNVETFSADAARITFTGVSVHPGTARGRLVNALTYMGKLLDRLPAGESPEGTDGLTEDELMDLVSRDSMIGVADVHNPSD